MQKVSILLILYLLIIYVNKFNLLRENKNHEIINFEPSIDILFLCECVPLETKISMQTHLTVTNDWVGESKLTLISSTVFLTSLFLLLYLIIYVDKYY